MNLPNAITIGRITITPLVALLPFVDSWEWRLTAFVIFVVAAATDYYDGMLARTRNQVTPLGQLLDPLADKFLLVATVVPMFLLVGSGRSWRLLSPLMANAGGESGPLWIAQGVERFPFVTPFGLVGLPWWILAIVFGREVFMTAFRQLAARRGVIIAAIGPAKWKTAFQSVWVGSTFFWFFIATLADHRGWDNAPWRAFANFNGVVGTLTMLGATLLTVYSLVLYIHRFGWVFTGRQRVN